MYIHYDIIIKNYGGKQMPAVYIRLNKTKDADVIKFLELQSNKTLAIKFVIRKLIKQIGYKDIFKIIDFKNVKIK